VTVVGSRTLGLRFVTVVTGFVVGNRRLGLRFVMIVTVSGKRIGRRKRLYRTKNGRKVCADVNSAYNILRKSRPDAFAKGIAGYVVHLLQQAV